MERRLLSLLSLTLLFNSFAMGQKCPLSTAKAQQTTVAVNCNQDDIIRDLRRQGIRPSGDGITPWSRLIGAWVNTERNIVVVIKNETVRVNEILRPGVRVRIYNLCTSALVAEGARALEKSDFKRDDLAIRLAFASKTADRTHVDAYFKIMKDASGQKIYVDAQIFSSNLANRRLSDRFRLIQP